MNLGVQYYRAPFPEQQYWDKDFAKIKASGLNTVQLWVLWGWVEASPDKFNYDDYDRLIELADKHGLGLILSTIAEIQPHWIHRVVPDSEMIDHHGNKVISSLRCESHFGLTPGGCTDNPGVWDRMRRFLTTTGERYHGLAHLRGWDAWNELRWNVQADAIVCFCPHTLAAFRLWLDQQYGGLDGLNAAWKRRYECWDDVMPGKLPDRPYTEMMAFEHFITCRANQHALERYKVLKAIDKVHPVTVHGAAPSALYCGGEWNYPIDRGNDWNLAEQLDGIGCSSFPQWGGIDDADFGMRIEMVKSAAENKLVWLSELQGGRAAVGFNIYGKVEALPQQRWVWNGLACGADTILFWCWRDEVFGRESSGFGLAGNDGLADERLAAMKITGDLLEKHRALISSYKPAQAEVGIMFSPQAYYLSWAQDGLTGRMLDALNGYARALIRQSIPCQFIEEAHLKDLARFKIIFLPRGIVIDEEQERKLTDYVMNGGTLFCESECGAFDRCGFYRYPENRFLQRLCGIEELGRRNLEGETVIAGLNGQNFELNMEQWLTPLKLSPAAPVKVMAEFNGSPLIAEYKAGKGKVIYCGSYPGNGYMKKYHAGFEDFLAAVVAESELEGKIEIVSPVTTADKYLYVKYGRCAGGHMVFVFFPEGIEQAEVNFTAGLFPGGKATELFSGTELTLRNIDGKRRGVIHPGPFRFAVLTDAV